MPSRAALYLRVSTDKQSTANQRPEVEQLVRARGFEVVHAYEEQASAAKHTGARRSEFIEVTQSDLELATRLFQEVVHDEPLP